MMNFVERISTSNSTEIWIGFNKEKLQGLFKCKWGVKITRFIWLHFENKMIQIRILFLELDIPVLNFLFDDDPNKQRIDLTAESSSGKIKWTLWPESYKHFFSALVWKNLLKKPLDS